MKKISHTLILLLIAMAVRSASEIPKVTIEYSSFFDSTCALLKGYDIKDVWKEELKKN